MPTPDEESRLEQTKMSFGEHLEELRRAVFKSVIALVLGFIIGLCIGMPLVDYIQGPLQKALREHHLRQATAKQLAWLEEQQAAGKTVPEDLPAAAAKMVAQGGVPHEYLVQPAELAASLAEHYPELASALTAEREPADSATDSTPESSAENAPESPSDNGAESAADPARAPAMIRLRLYEPLAEQDRIQTIATDSFEPFLVYIKASFAAGLVLASPFIFFFVWDFVAAGLYHSEKKYVHIYLPFSLTLFTAGAAVAYYFAFDYMLEFLFWFHEQMGIEPYPRISDWITTVVLMPLAFGVSFQLPLVMLLLERIGVFTVESYLSKWRLAVVIIAVLSMVLTPSTDLASMLLMFTPMVGLYFLGIALCRHMPGGALRMRQSAPAPASPPKPRPPEHDAGS